MSRRLAALASLGLCALGFALALTALLGGNGAVALVLPGARLALALDGLGLYFLLVVMAAGAAASAAWLDSESATPCFPALLGALALTLLAGDLFTLALGFFLAALAGAALVAGPEEQSRASVLSALGVALFGLACLLPALGLLAAGGELRFAAIRAHPPEGWRAALVLALTLTGAGGQAGLFPFHAWLPRAHAPAHAAAALSGAATAVALYVLVRLLFDLCGPIQPAWWGAPPMLLGAAGAVLGMWRATLEEELDTVLTATTAGNTGLVAVGLGLALAARALDLSSLASLALGGALLAVLVHGLFKPLLLIAAGAAHRAGGSRRLSRLGGLIRGMPIATACVLIGAGSLAALPPGPGFVALWMLWQGAIGGARIGGPALQTLAGLAAAMMALAAALAALAAVRLVGVAFLGRPRTPRASAAEEAPRATRFTLVALAGACALAGLFPSLPLALAGPAVRRLTLDNLAGRAGGLALAPQPGLTLYSGVGIALLLALAAGAVALLVRLAVPGQRSVPAWEDGLGPPPPWLPFGDPLTQVSAGGLAEPLGRASDPTERLLHRPLAAALAGLAAGAERLHTLAARAGPAAPLAALALLLALVALAGLVR